MENIYILVSLILMLVLALYYLAQQLKLFKNEINNTVLKNMTEAQIVQNKVLLEIKESLRNDIHDLQMEQVKQSSDLSKQLTESLNKSNSLLQKGLNEYRETFDARQLEALKIQQDNLILGMSDVRNRVVDTLNRNTKVLGEKVESLTNSTDNRLREISLRVDKRLNEGFKKTNETFTDVVKRLALIDQAQKKITELSSDVVSLQEVLADKRSRGVFGEIQLAALVRNVMPENSFSLQHTLSNKTRVDCILFLPKPSGNICIDSKFPLESYKIMTDIETIKSDRIIAEKQFRQDIKKHINDIAKKYIIEGETSDGAVMFIPAEAIFSEIHAHFYDLVEIAQKAKVWLVSPTTLMAVLTTARAVLKDSATRKQVHVIQEHLMNLSKDFSRFQTRMDNLSRHIEQANKDVNDVNTSAKKISSRFEKIENVELLDDVTDRSIK